jgi:hypothetical protein
MPPHESWQPMSMPGFGCTTQAWNYASAYDRLYGGSQMREKFRTTGMGSFCSNPCGSWQRLADESGDYSVVPLYCRQDDP